MNLGMYLNSLILLNTVGLTCPVTWQLCTKCVWHILMNSERSAMSEEHNSMFSKNFWQSQSFSSRNKTNIVYQTIPGSIYLHRACMRTPGNFPHNITSYCSFQK
ncbi:hypothetical protein AB205_0219360 [Aquarana catesbeiana]|uniref:Secreted protein n=1 Tax=Aquarana catesbeiana TaxID=8400 RepID=A0A2G9SLQ6_AQUCT|nr:hypothetical protein AB205_0219360 [Aquarana catesbeiana]PIO41140.1 hypothetical protein AB205_0219360 [Aquarana catesbeiana]